MAGDRGLAFVVISLISFSAFSIIGARRASRQPKLGVVTTALAPNSPNQYFISQPFDSDAAIQTSTWHALRSDRITALDLQAEAISGSLPEGNSFAPATLARLRAHLLLQDASSRFGAEFGIQ